MSIATHSNGGLLDKALSVFEGIKKRNPAIATQYIDSEKFINHNVHAYDGIAGVEGFISHLPPATATAPLTVVRAFQDGQYVFTHAEGDVFGPTVLFDIFKFEDGKIVEHWDNATSAKPPNASGHTSTDGPTKAEDLELTEQNKAIVKDFYESIFLKGQFERMGSFFNGDNFIRHDPRGGDGLTALMTMIRKQVQEGVVMTVDRIALILGEGNFVLVAAGGSIADKPVAYYDLFRLEGGKIAEHWDVIEETPPRDQWNNNNGKF
jgi:predicted SnoaL-like aldol condensation-catalyzing enzyme